MSERHARTHGGPSLQRHAPNQLVMSLDKSCVIHWASEWVTNSQTCSGPPSDFLAQSRPGKLASCANIATCRKLWVTGTERWENSMNTYDPCPVWSHQWQEAFPNQRQQPGSVQGVLELAAWPWGGCKRGHALLSASVSPLVKGHH